MTTAIEYALMAGASYISNRDPKNQFPIPQEWEKLMNPDSYVNDMPTGFEAISFIKGAEIVISYAGTNFANKFTDFFYGNTPLALGKLSDQLRQAADYYLQVKAANPNATITFTGHSLGGGLASLMAVMFNEKAYTFDQAPFRNSAVTYFTPVAEDGRTETRSVAKDLLTYLSSQTANAGILGSGQFRLAKV